MERSQQISHNGFMGTFNILCDEYQINEVGVFNPSNSWYMGRWDFE